MEGIDFYYLRMPQISFSKLQDLLEQGSLTTFIKQPVVREAIFLASPSLHEHILIDPGLRDKKLRQTVLKYILRMGCRSTPFGLFAGCSLGHFASSNNLDLVDRELMCQYRLNTNVIWELLRHFKKKSELFLQFRFQINTSLYTIGNQFRYLELFEESQPHHYQISQIKSHLALRLTLSKARNGATLEQFVNLLSKHGYDQDQARTYIIQLITDQVLVSDLALNITGPDPLCRLIDLLQNTSVGEPASEILHQVHSTLNQRLPIWMKHKIVSKLLEEGIGVKLPDMSLLQGDSFFIGQAPLLSSTLLTDLSKSLKKLFVLGSFQSPFDELKKFKQAFYARYEDREIPLTLALDAESGIGYGMPPLPGDKCIIQELIDDNTYSKYKKEPSYLSENFSFEQWLIQLYSSWVNQDEPILEITDNDLLALPDSFNKAPNSYYILGYFLASSTQALDAGDYLFRSKLVAGPQALSLLGRFGNADQELAKKMKLAFQRSQSMDSNRIHAEIVHLPTAAIGNVIQRPHLSEYEIPYLGYSTLPKEKQISIDDLWVSVPKGERIILRSRRLRKEIVPRLTTAHNYQNSLPTYHFLCDLQQQEDAFKLHWNWGGLNNYRFLPRVQYRQIILQEAKWRIEFNDFIATKSEEENIKSWRQKWRWPRFIALVHTDQELFLDMDSSICQELFITTLRRMKILHLIEWLPTAEQCCVNGPDGKYTHEVIIPIINEYPVIKQDLIEEKLSVVRRTFVPGTEWLYIKVYCGTQTINLILKKLGKLARSKIRSGQITHWFFIRYQDPNPHLRIRFHFSTNIQDFDLLFACQAQLQSLVDSGEVHCIQVDTYQRELERYGEQYIEDTELLFWADSDAIHSIYQYPIDDRTRLMIALLGVDRYLNDFGFNKTQKLKFCQERFKTLVGENDTEYISQKKLAKLYRDNYSMVNSVLGNKQNKLIELAYFHNLLKKRSRRNKLLFQLIINTHPQKDYYVSSVIHMFINRLFEQHQSSYELVIYHHLNRYFISQFYYPQ